jgi:hypothetical protein
MADFVPPDPLIKHIQQEMEEARGIGWWDEVQNKIRLA